MQWNTNVSGSPAGGAVTGPWIPGDGSEESGVLNCVQSATVFLDSSVNGRTVLSTVQVGPGTGYQATAPLSDGKYYRVRYLNGGTADTNPILLGISGTPVPPPSGGTGAAGPTDPAWTDVATPLPHGWANLGNGYAPLRYRKINGLTVVSGMLNGTAVTAGGVGAAIFNLPAGYRPLVMLARSSTFLATGSTGVAEVDVTPAGDVVWFGPQVTSWAEFEDIVFLAEQ